jgi:hypothetical protein
MVTGKTVGGTELFSKENRLTRAEALRLTPPCRATWS